MLRWQSKDPNEVLDYKIDWTDRLAGDTIVSVQWVVPAGIVADSNSFSPTEAILWLSGGTSGELYIMTCRVTTAGGRVMDESVRLRVKDR